MRTFYAAGGRSQDAKAFVSGRRWAFDNANRQKSNHVAAMTMVPSMTIDAEFRTTKDGPGVSLLGSHVGNHLSRGEWAELELLVPTDNRIIRLGD